MANEAGGYEQEREARIKENMERMQKLGILDLANRFNQSGAGSGRSRWRRKPETPGSPVVMKPAASPAPSRRSLRLKSQDPVCYAEIRTKEEKDLQGGKCFSIEHGSREEVYTEEHDKLLGTCETPWTLFVDGYDKDGKRIYDQARGQTCHQCRQKTLGHHTSCCKCQIVQGQFCGDCLYMRYGENVLEAKKNPNWVCPVCRGICNCSICRTKKGWFPTGAAYRKIVKLGYKSVAHYLIATQRASDDSADSNSADSSNNLPPTKSEGSSNSEHAVATKPELEDAQVTSKVSQNTRSDCLAVDSDGYMEDAGKDNTEQNEGNNKAPVEDEMIRAKGKGEIIDLCKDDSRSESGVTFEDVQGNQDNGCVTPSKPLRKRKLIERTPDCVASRLRSRSIKA